jgi:hypothetical protein
MPAPGGWAIVSGTSLRRVLMGPGSGLGRLAIAEAAWITLVLVTLATGWVPDLYGSTVALAVACGIVVAAALVALHLWRRSPPIEIDTETGTLRIGRSVATADRVTQALFVGLPGADGTDWYLAFGASVAPIAAVLVRSSSRPEITLDERRIVAELLRRSSVAIPESKPDPYDPKGRFAGLDHRNNLTRDEAIEYVLQTPASGEPVRTPPKRKSIWIDEDD